MLPVSAAGVQTYRDRPESRQLALLPRCGSVAMKTDQIEMRINF